METMPSRHRELRKQFLAFLAFSVFEIGYLVIHGVKLETVRDWIILLGAIFFPICALLSFFAMQRQWSAEQEDRVFTRTLGWIVLGPIVLILAGVGLYAAFGWFAAIPSWAAVIIVLLVLLLAKK